VVDEAEVTNQVNVADEAKADEANEADVAD
jgi:hypothetical protein